MSISVRGISKLYGNQKALDSVSFEIKSGEIVGFLGPNGAGKSTMMKILTCFIPQSSGNASVNGFDINTEAEEIKKSVGYLPESNPLYYDMYVKEYLGFIGEIYGVSKLDQRVKEMIALTGLEPEKHKKIGALSKGYKQRVGLAQALIHDPKVLILDEPTSGLDPNQLIEIRNLITQAGREKTVMLSTHIMQEVEAICNRIIIINQGKIVADNEVSEIKKSQNHVMVFTVEFDQSTDSSFFENFTVKVRAENPSGNLWILESETDIRAELFKNSVEKGFTILHVNKEEMKLEEAFRKYTGK